MEKSVYGEPDQQKWVEFRETEAKKLYIISAIIIVIFVIIFGVMVAAILGNPRVNGGDIVKAVFILGIGVGIGSLLIYSAKNAGKNAVSEWDTAQKEIVAEMGPGVTRAEAVSALKTRESMQKTRRAMRNASRGRRRKNTIEVAGIGIQL